MQYGRFTILVFLFAGLIKPVSAQQLIFKNYTVNDGLVSNAVRRIFQDSKGFLWIATWEGLSKYDGHKFSNYTTASGLSHNLVNDLYESANGKLYVATNGRSIDMVNQNNAIEKATSSAITVNRFTHLPGGKMLATTDDEGLQEFNNGKLTRINKYLLLPTYFNFTVINDSVFIAVSERAIQLLNRKFELLSQVIDHNPVYTEFNIYQDSKKRIFVGTETGLKILSEIPKKDQPITLTSPPAPFNIPGLQRNKINDILEDADGIIWIGTNNGLFKIKPDGSYQLITKKDGIASNNISTIFQDAEKNIWFGTSLGLSKLVTRSSILVYTTENGLLANDVYFIEPVIKEHLLVSTQKGTQVFNTGNGKFTPVTNIMDPPYFSVVPNSHPPLVIGAYKMAVFDTATLQYVKALPSPFPLNGFSNIVSDNYANFFLSDNVHLYFVSQKKDQTVTILKDLVSNLLLDSKGNLWAGTWEKGIYRIQYSLDNKRFRIIAIKKFLPAENIRSLFEDSKGNIWAGTRYHGLYRFSNTGANDYSVLNIDQSKGLSSNWIKKIAEAANGDLWIAAYQGLDKLIPQNNYYRVFNFSKLNNYFGNITGMLTIGDHSLWLATSEGIVHINDGGMERMPASPVYITKVSAPDSVYQLHTEKLKLDYRHNQLQFEFSSPGFINEKQVLYSYRLSGGSSDTSWSEPGNLYSVSYASLQPGKYLFEVKAMGWNGYWGKPAVFAFTIKPPFWQTGWFLIICSLLFFTAIYLAVRKRIKTVRNQAAMKQQITETEMAALKAQMNPHFMFNCINSIDAFIHSNDKYNATLYLNKFAKLLRNILDSSKQNTVAFTKDIETLKLYIELEELRNDNKFRTTIDIDSVLLESDYKVPPLIIQPFVENAILHGLKNKDGNDGLLEIEIIKVANTIEYSIKDNGIGRKAAGLMEQNKESSYGMQLSYDRTRLFNKEEVASIKVSDLYEDNGSTGTLIKVQLKII